MYPSKRINCVRALTKNKSLTSTIIKALRVSDSLLGYGSSKVVGLVRGYKNLRSIDRTALAREMANYLNEIFASRLIKPLGITALIIVLAAIQTINSHIQIKK
jgi:hypothetical protein